MENYNEVAPTAAESGAATAPTAAENGAATAHYAPTAPVPAPTEVRVYDSAERLLVLVALAIGLIFRVLFEDISENYDLWMSALYTLLWAVYAAGFFIARRGRKVSEIAWAPFVAAFLLLARRFVYPDSGSRGFDEYSTVLNAMNIAIVPALLMLHWALADIRAEDGGWDMVKRWLMGWFVAPFSAIWRLFPAIGSAFSRKQSNEQRRAVILGVVIGVPLFIAVAALLINADSAMELVFGRAFNDIGFGTVFGYIACMLVCGSLFYSFLFNTKNMPAFKAAREISLPALTGKIIISMLLVAYAVFAAFQFTYLTGLKGLPEELTYSEYAVSGFGELLVVAAINLALYAFARPAAENDRAVRALCCGLLAASGVVLYSALVRLLMYMAAYRFTVSRVLAFWFIVYLAFAFVLCFVRLFRRYSAVRIAMLGLIAWYLVLNFLPLMTMLA